MLVDAEKLLAVDHVTRCVLPIKAGAGMSDHHSQKIPDDKDVRRRKNKKNPEFSGTKRFRTAC